MLSNKLSKKPKPNKVELNSSTLDFEAIGTSWRITIEQHLSEDILSNLSSAINNRIEEFDHNYSRFRSDSLVTAMSAKKGVYKLPNDAKPLFDFYEQLYKMTGGLVTPLVGQLLSDAGYDSDYSLLPKKLRDIPSWAEAITYSFPDLNVRKPVLIDVGAAGKGYLVDIIGDLLKQTGITKFCINAGGDILNQNVSNSLAMVGLEHPEKMDEIIGVAKIQNQSICSSAGNRRFWANFHHIINPKTKKSSDDILSTWVVADNAMLADGIATALFFTEAPTLNQAFDFEYALIRKDFSLEHSNKFPADFFTEERMIT
jgi:thiamine biosynthesis lipoprotein